MDKNDKNLCIVWFTHSEYQECPSSLFFENISYWVDIRQPQVTCRDVVNKIDCLAAWLLFGEMIQFAETGRGTNGKHII